MQTKTPERLVAEICEAGKMGRWNVLLLPAKAVWVSRCAEWKYAAELPQAAVMGLNESFAEYVVRVGR